MAVDVAQLLSFAVKNNASDLHLSSGLPPMIRVDGDVRRINVPPLDHAQVHDLIYDIMNDKQRKDFGEDIIEKVERDIYLQVMDNLWMQHLENMDHLRQGIHWSSVGQRDPLVEYRRRSKLIFEEMQTVLRHDVVRALFHARPVGHDHIHDPIETELTRAARASVDNADKIVNTDDSFDEDDFKVVKSGNTSAGSKKKISNTKRKKNRKAQRTNRKKNRKK